MSRVRAVNVPRFLHRSPREGGDEAFMKVWMPLSRHERS
jgi:hypothetical protein